MSPGAPLCVVFAAALLSSIVWGQEEESSVQLEVCYQCAICSNGYVLKCYYLTRKHSLAFRLACKQSKSLHLRGPGLRLLRAAALNQSMRSPILAQRHRAPVAKWHRVRAMLPNAPHWGRRKDLRFDLHGHAFAECSRSVASSSKTVQGACFRMWAVRHRGDGPTGAAQTPEVPRRARTCHVGSMRRARSRLTTTLLSTVYRVLPPIH